MIVFFTAIPINNAESIVKIYACKKATKTSINVIKNDNTKDNPVAPTTPKDSLSVNIIAIKLITTI